MANGFLEPKLNLVTSVVGLVEEWRDQNAKKETRAINRVSKSVKEGVLEAVKVEEGSGREGREVGRDREGSATADEWDSHKAWLSANVDGGREEGTVANEGVQKEADAHCVPERMSEEEFEGRESAIEVVPQTDARVIATTQTTSCTEEHNTAVRHSNSSGKVSKSELAELLRVTNKVC